MHVIFDLTDALNLVKGYFKDDFINIVIDEKIHILKEFSNECVGDPAVLNQLFKMIGDGSFLKALTTMQSFPPRQEFRAAECFVRLENELFTILATELLIPKKYDLSTLDGFTRHGHNVIKVNVNAYSD